LVVLKVGHTVFLVHTILRNRNKTPILNRHQGLGSLHNQQDQPPSIHPGSAVRELVAIEEASAVVDCWYRESSVRVQDKIKHQNQLRVLATTRRLDTITYGRIC
jgi:hypothetical protein